MSVAYLSAEVGFESGLHTYSGGLGVLAGDHIKSAADAGVDLVGCTLLYRKGYGRQHLDSEGNQTETYAEIDPQEYLCETGVEIAIPLDGTLLHSKVWLYKIKGVSTYFLDTRHPNNSPEHTSLGNRLYGGDDSTRIRQEYLLGVGGIRALQALGHEITGLHLNEGHCTFAMLEMLHQGWTREQLRQRCLFTTHTPVPAGHDRFSWDEVKTVLGDLLPDDARDLIDDQDSCSMSHLAVALAGQVNAVSNLNAYVASGMFEGTHIHPITNGVHHETWTSPALAQLFDTHLQGWRKDPTGLAHAGRIPDSELMSARRESRAVLRDLVRDTTGIELSEERLTIGFARRFATYKRANLIFSDLERLRSIGADRIQFVFAGKAHPRDEGGKQLIRDIFEGASKVSDEIPVVFLEDYSMDTGLAMTSGVDIWLNNPIRPMEASGTSGMKAAMNGVPNCSILDGWWPEACEHGVNGWGIGKGEDERDDERDAKAVYDTLEHEVLPAWNDGAEHWNDLMRASIATRARFTGSRMISDYLPFYSNFGSSS
ncbi:MAG: alpha-glucan family phosphorylase [Candidatus Thalassarchaeum sp.]|nr:alpha-glucan family phosphorylase [Candidatus Thalassarchaeum sp.]